MATTTKTAKKLYKVLNAKYGDEGIPEVYGKLNIMFTAANETAETDANRVDVFMTVERKTFTGAYRAFRKAIAQAVEDGILDEKDADWSIYCDDEKNPQAFLGRLGLLNENGDYTFEDKINGEYPEDGAKFMGGFDDNEDSFYFWFSIKGSYVEGHYFNTAAAVKVETNAPLCLPAPAEKLCLPAPAAITTEETAAEVDMHRFLVDVSSTVTGNGWEFSGTKSAVKETAQQAAQWAIDYAAKNPDRSITAVTIKDFATNAKYHSTDTDLAALNNTTTEETVAAVTTEETAAEVAPRRFLVNVFTEGTDLQGGIAWNSMKSASVATAQQAAQFAIDIATQNFDTTVKKVTIKDFATYAEYNSTDADLAAIEGMVDPAGKHIYEQYFFLYNWLNTYMDKCDATFEEAEKVYVTVCAGECDVSKTFKVKEETYAAIVEGYKEPVVEDTAEETAQEVTTAETPDEKLAELFSAGKQAWEAQRNAEIDSPEAKAFKKAKRAIAKFLDTTCNALSKALPKTITVADSWDEYEFNGSTDLPRFTIRDWRTDKSLGTYNTLAEVKAAIEVSYGAEAQEDTVIKMTLTATVSPKGALSLKKDGKTIGANDLLDCLSDTYRLGYGQAAAVMKAACYFGTLNIGTDKVQPPKNSDTFWITFKSGVEMNYPKAGAFLTDVKNFAYKHATATDEDKRIRRHDWFGDTVQELPRFEGGKTYCRTWHEDTGRPHIVKYTVAKRTAKTIVLKSGARCKIVTDADYGEIAKIGYGVYLYAKDLYNDDAITRQADADKAWDEMEREVDKRFRECRALALADKIARDFHSDDEPSAFSLLPAMDSLRDVEDAPTAKDTADALNELGKLKAKAKVVNVKYLHAIFAILVCKHFSLNDAGKAFASIYNEIYVEAQALNDEARKLFKVFKATATADEIIKHLPTFEFICGAVGHKTYDQASDVITTLENKLGDKALADGLSKLAAEFGIDRTLLLKSDDCRFNPAIFSEEIDATGAKPMTAEVVEGSDAEHETFIQRMEKIKTDDEADTCETELLVDVDKVKADEIADELNEYYTAQAAGTWYKITAINPHGGKNQPAVIWGIVYSKTERKFYVTSAPAYPPYGVAGICAGYATIDQTAAVVELLKAAIANRETTFAFPTVEELSAPIAIPFEKFTGELAKRKSAYETAQAAAGKATEAVIAARRALQEAEEAERKAKEAESQARYEYELFGEGTAGDLRLLITDEVINAKINGASLSQLWIDFYHDKLRIMNNWETLGTYDTPAQVENVIARLKAALERGDERFNFPTVEELSAPPFEAYDTDETFRANVMPPDELDADEELIDSREPATISDSLTRAMKIALLKVQEYCLRYDLKAAQNEMTLYGICAAAMRENLTKPIITPEAKK